MKKYFKEIIIFLLQIIVFYITPLFAGPTDIMGMVLLIILLTFILSILLGYISNNKLKYIYSLIIAIVFIPTIYIYYNNSALIHSIWYFVVSLAGLGIVTIFNLILKKNNNLKWGVIMNWAIIGGTVGVICGILLIISNKNKKDK